MTCASTNSANFCIHHRAPVLPWHRHAWLIYAQAMARRRERRALGALDDRQLADVGLTRAQAQREARKPFWVR
jgi:uncharacterized protein YjiS (DUF1127 family)